MRVALTFPGQGSQRPGMGQDWADTSVWSVVASASEALGLDVGRLLLDADAEELRDTHNAQVATYVTSMMALDQMRQELPSLEVVAVCGHSLGEYSALAAAGAMSRDEGLRLVAARGTAMRAAATANPGTMAAVLGLSAEQVEDALSLVEDCWVANLNGPGNVIITGTTEGIAAGTKAATDAGAKRVLPLQVGGAFHSPLMADAAESLGVALQETTWADSSVPVICNVDATSHTSGPEWAGLLARQLTSPVRWTETLEALDRLGVDVVAELGPGNVLTGIAKRVLPERAIASVQTPNDVQKFGEILQGA